MSKYIRDQNNKSMEKYLKVPNTDLVAKYNPSKSPNMYAIIHFVSLVSFLAGYNFCYYTIK